MRSDNRKKRVGQVVGDKMDKTVVVSVEWRQRHPLYRKSMKRITKFHAHDEQNDAKLGDTVLLMETRPISRLKRWTVAEILERHEVPEVKPQEIGMDVEEGFVKSTVAIAEESVAEEPVAEEVAEESIAEEPVAEEVAEEPVAEDKPEKESS
jgi:small subunit ribosomal protein S17